MGRILSDETKKKLSLLNTGKTHSLETKAKISKANLGKIMSQEAKDKAKDTKARNNKKPQYRLVTCPHCGLSGAGGNMTRYHFNNCKKLNHI